MFALIVLSGIIVSLFLMTVFIYVKNKLKYSEATYLENLFCKKLVEQKRYSRRPNTKEEYEYEVKNGYKDIVNYIFDGKFARKSSDLSSFENSSLDAHSQFEELESFGNFILTQSKDLKTLLDEDLKSRTSYHDDFEASTNTTLSERHVQKSL